MTNLIKASTAKANSTTYTSTVFEEIALLELYIIAAVDSGTLEATLNASSTVNINGITVTGSKMTNNDATGEAYYNVWKKSTTDAAKDAEMNAVIKHFQDLGYSINRKSTTGTILYWNITWN